MFLELRNDARAPPTVAVSVGVIFAPYVVEAVGHFMAANAAYASWKGLGLGFRWGVFRV